ncbi:MAG: phosphoribosylformylglycinamidine synthase subunit PurQ [Myxococcota bacterium]
MIVAVLQFPGSNCDQDVVHALGTVLGADVRLVWHGDAGLPTGTDLVVLPGGFSYGDYLRSGAIAARSPIMAPVRGFAESGGTVLGICNGFQVLTEAGMLPGALLRNTGVQFVCRDVCLRVESQASALTARLQPRSLHVMPVAHREGNYFADGPTLAALEATGRVLLRYADPLTGEASRDANPNGSAHGIAAIANEKGNVIGMMPHPERAVDAELGPTGGRAMLEGLLAEVRGRN